MASSAPDPGVIRRLDVDRPEPTPSDCLPECEEAVATVELSPGWIAATRRELFTYHPDRDPAVVRMPLSNVTGVAVRRAGGQAFVGYLPVGVLYAFGALALGFGLLAVDPNRFVDISGTGPTRQLLSIVDATARAMDLLGSFLVFTGVLSGLAIATVLGYWLVSREVSLVVERGQADPIECPTTRHAGTRALQELDELFEATDTPGRTE